MLCEIVTIMSYKVTPFILIFYQNITLMQVLIFIFFMLKLRCGGGR